MKLLPRKLHIVTKPIKLERPIGTSVAHIAYIPRDNHLRFARQHDRSTGELEKLPVPRSILNILGCLAVGGILAFATFCLFV